MGKINKVVVSGAVVGLILALSQPLYNLGILIFAGLVLFFLVLKIIRNKSRAFQFGYSTGLAYFLINFKWYWTVPLKNYGVENPFLTFFLIFFIWALTAGALALSWGISTWLMKKLDEKISWNALLIFPAIFTILEFLRSFLIGLIWIGKGTAIGPNWTLGNLAYNLHESFLILKLSSWLGIYGVTFLIIFAGLLLFIFLEKRRYKKFLILLLGLAAFTYFPSLQGSHVATGQPCREPCIEVAAIQTKISHQIAYTPAEEASFFKNQLELLDALKQNSPQPKLIVFPEGSNFFKTLTLFKDTWKASQYFNNLFSSSLIIDNSKVVSNSEFQSKTIFLDSKKGILGSYEKYLLTPGGEFLPLIFSGLNKILGLNSPAIQNAQNYQTGAKFPEGVVASEDLIVSAMVCSDIFSPYLAQNAAASANILVSQSSFSFTDDSEDLIELDLAAAKFRAAENDRYLLKASNFGRSFIISNQGKIVKITPNLDWQILTGSAVLKNNKTLYNRVGDSPILLGSLAILIASLFLRKHGNN